MLFLDNVRIGFLSFTKLLRCVGILIILASLNCFPMSWVEPEQHVVNISFNSCGTLCMSVARHHDEKLFYLHFILTINSPAYTLFPSLVAHCAPESHRKPKKHSDRQKIKYYTVILASFHCELWHSSSFCR